METLPGEVTHLLRRMAAGDRVAESELFTLLYSDLRRIAGAYMRGEQPGSTLQPTALVGELYVRMAQGEARTWQDRNHFLAVAASVMRHILIDHARRRWAQKRGAGARSVDLDDVLIFTLDNPDQILAIHEALERLAELDARQARIVELRYFGGLDVEEAAAVLAISPRTVKRDWTMARAWLSGELGAKSS